MKVLATWDHGLPANQEALRLLGAGGTALDAVVAGCVCTERDNGQRTVGLGGWPDRDGVVTLDAALMLCDGRAGSVAFVKGVEHPIRLARMVMERTPHVMLAGAGAERFAREQGVEVRERPLDAEQEAKWKAWLQEKRYAPAVNVENHDTISMIAVDAAGRMAVASTTSGLAFKMHGRVGDSPVIGSGLFVDRGVGGAVCTGLGEAVLRTAGAHAIVEAMRAGMSPQHACEALIHRMIDRIPGSDDYQVGVLAMDFSGRTGAFSVQRGFTYALAERGANAMHAAPAALGQDSTIEVAMKVQDRRR
jgi:isoaspartyl peptidase/L-asparaginase-like protein (Ntn-hydrolase superfamily)